MIFSCASFTSARSLTRSLNLQRAREPSDAVNGKSPRDYQLNWRPTSHPFLSLQGANLLLSWTGGSGIYQVQATTDLAGAAWQNCGLAGSFTNLTLVRTNRMCFYRVVQQ